jgi:hypothetical protein
MNSKTLALTTELATRSRSIDFFALGNMYLPNPDPAKVRRVGAGSKPALAAIANNIAYRNQGGSRAASLQGDYHQWPYQH